MKQIKLPDGSIGQFPDDMPDADIERVLAKEFAPSNLSQNGFSGSSLDRFLFQANKPLEAGAQYLPWALGALTGGFGLAPNRVSDWLFDQSRQRVESYEQNKKALESARASRGEDPQSVGLPEFLGAATSPSGLAIGYATGGMPAGALARSAFGAGLGLIGGISDPVEKFDKFGWQKGGQAAVGAVTGAALTPVIGAAGDVVGKIADRVAHLVTRFAGKTPSVTDDQITFTIRQELARENIDIDSLPQTVLTSIKKDVRAALSGGKSVSPADLLRQQDFKAVGTEGTLGQITRDPVQYTREMNLRGVEGAGEPLMRRFNEQRQRFGDVFTNMGASKADDAYTAGSNLISTLRGIDKPAKSAVDEAYKTARNASGRYAQMDTPAFSKAANDALDQGQLGYVLPAEARTLLNDISSGKLPLNVNTYTQVRSLLSNMAAEKYKSGATNAGLAVNKVIEALDNTPLLAGEDDVARMLFSNARELAAKRFKALDIVPALKDAVNGKANPDKFVTKYIINAGTDDVTNLSAAMTQEGRETIRNQIARHLEQKAFGSNVSGDAGFAIERYNGELFRLGRKRLAAFFDKDEVDTLFALGRAAAWAGKRPAGSAVNESNTAAAAMNLFSRMKGAGIALPVVKHFVSASMARTATQPQIPAQEIPVLSPALRDLLAPMPFGAGALGASYLSQ